MKLQFFDEIEIRDCFSIEGGYFIFFGTDCTHEIKQIVEFSICEDIIYDFLYPFLKRHFDSKLEDNCTRVMCMNSDITFEFNNVNYYLIETAELLVKDIDAFVKSLEQKDKNAIIFLNSSSISSYFKAYHNVIDFDIKLKMTIDFYEKFNCLFAELITKTKQNNLNLICIEGP